MAIEWERHADQFGNTKWTARAAMREGDPRPMTWKIIPIVLDDRLRWSVHGSSIGLLWEIPPGGSGDGFESPDEAKAFCDYREAVAPIG